jgi:hypothetical protein
MLNQCSLAVLMVIGIASGQYGAWAQDVCGECPVPQGTREPGNYGPGSIGYIYHNQCPSLGSLKSPALIDVIGRTMPPANNSNDYQE